MVLETISAPDIIIQTDEWPFAANTEFLKEARVTVPYRLDR